MDPKDGLITTDTLLLNGTNQGCTSDTVKVSDEELRIILTNDVLKRDTLDGDLPKEAKAMVKKAVTALAKRQAKAAAVGSL